MQQAQQKWEEENKINETDIFSFNEEEMDKLRDAAPWAKDPNYFESVAISAVALMKIVIHAQAGGSLEVMGLITGKVKGKQFIVLDAYGLPVEGTETRVNAGATALEFAVTFKDAGEKVGKQEGVVGWYHSHPGYSCWLSGIDVKTQALHQQGEEPYLAIVIDPVRTASTGRVELGCFRTYPENYTKKNAELQWQQIPLEKIEDWGTNYGQYYKLEHSFFKSSMDTMIMQALWNKYWMQTLGSSQLYTNRDYYATQIKDLSAKLEKYEEGGRKGIGMKNESNLERTVLDSQKLAIEEASAIAQNLIKRMIFS